MNGAGTLKIRDGRYVLRFERRLAHPVDKVWRAVTEPEHTAQWLPAAMEWEPRVGGTVRWIFAGGAGQTQGQVTAYDPPRLLEYTMSSEGLPLAGTGDDRTIRIELYPDDGGCRLVFINSFGDGPGAASFAAGWEGCLDALAHHLDEPGGAPPVVDHVRLHEEYVDRFDLVAATARQAAGDPTIRLERQFPYPRDRVQAALDDLVNGTDGNLRWELADGPGGARVYLRHSPPPGRRDTALADDVDLLAALADRLNR